MSPRYSDIHGALCAALEAVDGMKMERGDLSIFEMHRQVELDNIVVVGQQGVSTITVIRVEGF
jgi:hypothetical protein